MRGPGEQVRPNHTTQYTHNTFPYRVPGTQTVLDIRYGRPTDPDYIDTILDLVQHDIVRRRLGRFPAAVPNGEYDFKTDNLGLSVYSPSEVPPGERLTWLILDNVVIGLVDLLLVGHKYRQVNFRVGHGPNRQFVGYGHLVQGSDRAPE
ncbi:MAG: hypothetical protein Q9223_000488 [Gallowayella weberi]